MKKTYKAEKRAVNTGKDTVAQEAKEPDGRGTEEREKNDPEKKEQGKKETKATEYPVVEKEILPEKVLCPDCGGLTTEGLVFCELCGGEMEPMEPEEYARLQKEFGRWLEKEKQSEQI